MHRSSLRRFVAVGSAVVFCLVITAGCGRDEAVFGDIAASPIAATATPAPGPSPTFSGSADIVPGQLRRWAEGVTPAPGIPAIQPSLEVEPERSAITEQDVREFIATHPPEGWDPTSPPVTIKRIEFLPVQDIEVRLDQFISLPTDTLLCLVTLEGKWLPPPGIEIKGTPIPNTVMYRIYDAQTGNFIAWTSGVESE